MHVFQDVQLFERLQSCDDFQVFSAHCECPSLTKIWIPSHCKFQLALINRALLKSCRINISGNHRQHVHHGICMDQIWLSTESSVFLQQTDQITELRLFVPFAGVLVDGPLQADGCAPVVSLFEVHLLLTWIQSPADFMLRTMDTNTSRNHSPQSSSHMEGTLPGKVHPAE